MGHDERLPGIGLAIRLLGTAPEVHLPRERPVPTMGQKAKRTVHHRGGANKRGSQANLAEMNDE